MEVFQGIPVFGGIAEGTLLFLPKDRHNTVCIRVSNPEKEVERYDRACKTITDRLEELYQKALNEIGESKAKILDIYKLIVMDSEFTGNVRTLIREKRVNAEYAVSFAADELCDRFLSLGDEYLRVRTSDIRDISGNIIDVLNGDTTDRIISLTEPVILMADELTPSETIRIDKSKVLAIVTRKGSTLSHTAILAKTMNIPAIIGINGRKNWNGRQAILDGYTGQIFLDPDEKTIASYTEKRTRAADISKQYSALKTREDVTKSGKHIFLYANISDLSDVDNVADYNAAGIGLFRSEFLYILSNTCPT